MTDKETDMTREALVALYARRMEKGESVKALAQEVGLSVQKLMGLWRKFGLGETTTERSEFENAPPEEEVTETTEPVPPVELPAELVAAVEQPAAEPVVPVAEPVTELPVPIPSVTEEPKKAAKPKPTPIDPEKVKAAVEAKKAGKKWSEIGELLGCSWNRAWGVVNEVAPELCGKK